MQSFHDWFIVGVAVNMNAHELTLQLRDDYGKRSAILSFEGATRFIVDGFVAQNIVYDLTVLEDFNSTEYKAARTELETAHPWGSNWPTKNIATISASLGAEVTVEFDRMRIVEATESPNG